MSFQTCKTLFILGTQIKMFLMQSERFLTLNALTKMNHGFTTNETKKHGYYS